MKFKVSVSVCVCIYIIQVPTQKHPIPIWFFKIVLLCSILHDLMCCFLSDSMFSLTARLQIARAGMLISILYILTHNTERATMKLVKDLSRQKL